MDPFTAGAEICQGPVLLGGAPVLCEVLPCGHPDLGLVLHPQHPQKVCSDIREDLHTLFIHYSVNLVFLSGQSIPF